jgi:hypothetical protein
MPRSRHWPYVPGLVTSICRAAVPPFSASRPGAAAHNLKIPDSLQVHHVIEPRADVDRALPNVAAPPLALEVGQMVLIIKTF